jgi:hypothetical protein
MSMEALRTFALANAALFRRCWHGRIDGVMPRVTRGMALGSLALWISIAGLGRWIAYARRAR